MFVQVTHTKLLFTFFLFLAGMLFIPQCKEEEPTNAQLKFERLMPYDTKPSRKVFLLAMKGYDRLKAGGKLRNKKYITIVDFSITSENKRLWVINLETENIEVHTWVAHGENSGVNSAKHFSNLIESHQSSIGFYVTGETYNGANGYSLKLDGQERGFNNNARKRAVVFHGATYATYNYVIKNGRLGRSYGCPAVPPSVNKKIINRIKNRSCVFMYYPEKLYMKKSKFVN